jgi:hypothetical protein
MWAGSRSDTPDGVLTEYHPYTTDDQENGAPGTGNKWNGKKWAPNSEIESKVEEIKVDKNSKQAFDGLLEGVINEATNLNSGDNITFDKEKYSNLISNNIIENGKLRSLARHKIFGGRSFKKDLKEALRTNTYEELGIPKELVESLDPTDNGKISRRDARVIWRAIRDDETMLKKYLTGYYTNALEQNFNANISSDAKNSKNKRDEEEGVYTDHDKDWDYKVVNGEWWARRKPDGGWSNIQEKFPESVEKLNKKYPNAGGKGTQTYVPLNNGYIDFNNNYNPIGMDGVERPAPVDKTYVHTNIKDLNLPKYNLPYPNANLELIDNQQFDAQAHLLRLIEENKGKKFDFNIPNK